MLYIAADHNGYKYKQELITQLARYDIQSQDVYEVFDPGDDYPVVASYLARLLKDPEHKGLALCGTGQGICMALNRYPHVRAGIGVDEKTVEMIRKHNHANCLCLPAWNFNLKNAISLIRLFLATNEDLDPRHLRRISMLENPVDLEDNSS